MKTLQRSAGGVLLALLLAVIVPGQVAPSQPQVDAALVAAKAKLAPDRRTVVFDVEARADGGRVVLRGEVHSELLQRQLIAHLGRALPGAVINDQLLVLPDPALGQHTLGIVCVSVANLRSKPGHAQELGTQALLGTPLRILKKQGGWSYVQTPNDYLCWTNDRIQPMTAAEFAAFRAAPKIVVTDTFAVVRQTPAAASRPVGDVVAGCMLTLVGQQGDVYRVRYADGRTGCLPQTAATELAGWLEREPATAADIVATAYRFVGVPYLWGGTSCKGMDCSGYSSTVYFLNGLLLPRDASQQVHAGLPVPIDDGLRRVQAGDLLFFGSKASAARRERVTHVAISLGGARFIHASTDVHENSLDPDDPDYSASLQQRLLHVRRMLGAGAEAGVRPLADLDLYRKP